MIIAEFLGVPLLGTRVLAAQKYGSMEESRYWLCLKVRSLMTYLQLPESREARNDVSSEPAEGQLGNTQIPDISHVLARAILLSIKDQ